MRNPPRLDLGTAHLYARAVLAVARADDLLGLEEGQRLQELVSARAGIDLVLADLLLDEPVHPSELAHHVRYAPPPFRGETLSPGDFARLIVVDSLAVVLAKGYIAEAEARELMRFATALGCSRSEVRAFAAHAAPMLDLLDHV